MRRFANINAQSTTTLLDSAGPVVTLTTYGKRIESVFYTIESIAAGNVLPSRITLWLDDHEYEGKLPDALPDTLKRLIDRGLDVRTCKDHGPHKKYFPEVSMFPDLAVPFVTADDDTLYPKYWLETLVSNHDKNKNSVHCFRAHRIVLDESSEFIPYKKWARCLTKKASFLNFSTGDCGVLFPSQMRAILNDAGDAFLASCPKADDIWLNYHAMKSGTPVTQVVSVPKRFYEVPGTRSGALSTYNNGQGGNDIQLKNTYDPEARLHLLAEQNIEQR